MPSERVHLAHMTLTQMLQPIIILGQNSHLNMWFHNTNEPRKKKVLYHTQQKKHDPNKGFLVMFQAIWTTIHRGEPGRSSIGTASYKGRYDELWYIRKHEYGLKLSKIILFIHQKKPFCASNATLASKPKRQLQLVHLPKEGRKPPSFCQLISSRFPLKG